MTVRTASTPMGPLSVPMRTGEVAPSDWVFYDLETSGFGPNSTAILQLSAVCGDRTFNCYVDPLPNYVIPPGTSAVNQLRVVNGRLTYKNQLVQSKPLQQVFSLFIGWLRQFNRPILMGHNIFTFDNPIMYNNMKNIGLWQEFKKVVHGFVDTYELFRLEFPERKGKGELKQQTLVRELLNETYEAHSALEDVCSLQRLVRSINFSGGKFQKVFSDTASIEAKLAFNQKKRERAKTIKHMEKTGVVTAYMADKIARSGLEWQDLVSAASNDRKDGIRRLFTEPSGDESRVTDKEQVIESVTNYVMQHMQPGERASVTLRPCLVPAGWASVCLLPCMVKRLTPSVSDCLVPAVEIRTKYGLC